MRMGTKLKRWMVGSRASGLAAAAALLGPLGARALAGDCTTGAGTRIPANDAAAFDLYGQSVAVDGNTLVVGCWNDETPTVTGSAYVFERQAGAWQFVTKLLPPDGAAFDRFGWSVDVDGDTIAVGADADDAPQSDRGSAYVFVRVAGAWQFQQKLTSSVGASFDAFGASVKLSGDSLIVGATGHDFEAPNAGAAFVFTRSGATWSQQEILTDGNAVGGENFGASVSIDVDTAIVGANLSDLDGVDAGTAVTFVRNAGVWSPQPAFDSLLAIPAGAQFGFAVDLIGDDALVGAPLRDGAQADSGAVYHFRRFGPAWQFVDILTAPAPALNDQFGVSVALSVDAAVIGVLRGDTGGNDSGSALFFGRAGSNFGFVQALNATGVGPLDQFGISVAISDDAIAVGANQDDIVFTNTGAAYVFALNCGGLIGDLNCDGVISVGDIGPFVLALTDPAGYVAAFPTCDINLGDTNNDGIVSVGDIGSFVALLTGG